MAKLPSSQPGLHVIAKPIGPICNIRCAYCFYLEKETLYPKTKQWKMSDDTLEAYVRQYIEAQPGQIEDLGRVERVAMVGRCRPSAHRRGSNINKHQDIVENLNKQIISTS